MELDEAKQKQQKPGAEPEPGRVRHLWLWLVLPPESGYWATALEATTSPASKPARLLAPARCSGWLYFLRICVWPAISCVFDDES